MLEVLLIKHLESLAGFLAVSCLHLWPPPGAAGEVLPLLLSTEGRAPLNIVFLDGRKEREGDLRINVRNASLMSLRWHSETDESHVRIEHPTLSMHRVPLPCHLVIRFPKCVSLREVS